MGNSDYNDFRNWQNGDDSEENNPNNGFFFFGNTSPEFKKMWDQMRNGENPADSLRDYLNMDDILNEWTKEDKKKHFNPHNKFNPNNPPKHSRKPSRNKPKTTPFSQEEYFKLIEIRGYLAIQEQFAHVKALDKLLNQIIIKPVDNSGEFQ
jgi:hypothetical protein